MTGEDSIYAPLDEHSVIATVSVASDPEIESDVTAPDHDEPQVWKIHRIQWDKIHAESDDGLYAVEMPSNPLPGAQPRWMAWTRDENGESIGKRKLVYVFRVGSY